MILHVLYNTDLLTIPSKLKIYDLHFQMVSDFDDAACELWLASLDFVVCTTSVA